MSLGSNTRRADRCFESSGVMVSTTADSEVLARHLVLPKYLACSESNAVSSKESIVC